MSKDFLYCEETDTKIKNNDVVSIASYPDTKWIAKQGWYTEGTAQRNGWYFISLIDKTILPISLIDIKEISKDIASGSTEVRPELPSEPTQDNPKDFLYCEETDTKIYANDIVEVSGIKYVVKFGWYRLNDNQIEGWHFISLEDRTLLPLSEVNLSQAIKEQIVGTSELRPTLQDIDTLPPKVDFIVIPNTDIRLYDSDIVKLDNRPYLKWIVHLGWYIYNEVQNWGWYFVSIKDGEILPVTVVDLSLCSLEVLKTQGSESYDGKVVNYTRPFTDADVNILRRTFITLETLEQRDNLDPKKLINGKLVRVNDVGGVPNYYAWNEETQHWDKVDWGGSGGGGIPRIEGTYAHPVILSDIEEGLYRVLGVYKITLDSNPITTDIDHLAFVQGIEPTTIKIVTQASITDYIVTEGQITFSNEYTTKGYVDGQILLIEHQISELISNLPSIIDARIQEIFDPIPDSFIRSLFE